jgi:uncharacterized membrane protein YphA (DoxX/SURF4 family)
MSDGAPQRAGWAGGRGRGWAGARFGSPVGRREERVIARTAAPAESAPSAAPPGSAPSGAPPAKAAPSRATSAEWRAAAERAGDFAAQWAPTAGRILLGLVLAWFGYHELLLPGEWTGYVPVINETSDLAIIAVLVHGWVLLVLAVALIAGIAPRVSAAIASVLLLEIVISLSVSGLSDTSMRDVGVLGLAICLTGCRNQRLVLRG